MSEKLSVSHAQDLRPPHLRLVLQRAQTVQNAKQGITWDGSLRQAVRPHITRIQPNDGSQDSVVQELPEELHMAQQRLLSRRLDEHGGDSSENRHGINAQDLWDRVGA